MAQVCYIKYFLKPVPQLVIHKFYYSYRNALAVFVLDAFMASADILTIAIVIVINNAGVKSNQLKLMRY